MTGTPLSGDASISLLARIRRHALTRPDDLTSAEAEALAPALHSSEARTRALAVATLAAIAYGRPDLISGTHVAALLEGVRGVRETVDACELLQALATTPLAPEVASAVFPELHREEEPTLMGVLRALERWAPATLPLEPLLEAATVLPPALREELLAEVVEPLLERLAPKLTPTLLDRLEDLFGGTRRLAYTLHRLARAPVAPSEVAARTDRGSEDRFPWRRRARELLGRGPFHLLIVQNVRMGQGDELIRVGLLLQGLLASFPRLRCTVVTPRAYLWDHPRLTVIDLGDEPAVARALDGRWRGVFEIWEPRAPGCMLDPSLHERLDAAAARRRLALRLEGQLAWSWYVYERFDLDGTPLARELGVDRQGAFSVYDPSLRLLAELGAAWLPARSGDHALDPVAGSSSADADRLWEGYRGAPGRPTALVNAFGGAWVAKGFLPERLPVLARELDALVAEGFHAVVLPTGTPWCTPEMLDRLRRLAAPGTREHLAVAPDPGREVQGLLRERPDLPWADRVMRLFLRWARRADLVVTVEGWLAHRAAQVGTPVRLVPMARSHGFDWQPMVPLERSVTLAPGVEEPPEPLAGPDRPFPRRPRSHLLPLALGAPGAPDGRREDLAVLRHALGLYDPRLASRVAGAVAAYLPDPEAVELLRDTLDHEEPRVRGAAAACLLRLPEATLTAAGLRAGRLRVHRGIALQRWADVAREGDVALPLLARAARDSDELLAREAEWVLAQLLAQKVARRGNRQGDGAPAGHPGGP